MLLNSYHDSRLISIKVRCFATEQPELDKLNTHIFGCDMGSYPFRYLGILMHHRKLMNKDWKHVEERFQKKAELLEK